MKEKIEIRPLAEGDASEIYQLEKKSFPDPWSEDTIRASFRYPGAKTWGLYMGGTLIGYYFFSSVLDEGELMNLCVEESFRRRGFGKMLLRHMEENMRESEIFMVHLEVRSRNIPARTMYLAGGFREIGLRRGYYGDDDAVLMQKTLDEDLCEEVSEDQ